MIAFIPGLGMQELLYIILPVVMLIVFRKKMSRGATALAWGICLIAMSIYLLSMLQAAVLSEMQFRSSSAEMQKRFASDEMGMNDKKMEQLRVFSQYAMILNLVLFGGVITSIVGVVFLVIDNGRKTALIKPTAVVLSGSQLMVFVFTDLVDSTGLKQRLGDTPYVRAILKPHNMLFRIALGRFPSAIERDNAGDGFFITFSNLGEAVEFALLFQHVLSTFSWELEVPKTRIGIHLGDSTQFQDSAEQHKLAGQAQDLAARLMGLASGGQILLSRSVLDGARHFVRRHPAVAQGSHNGPELLWIGHGAYQLKGKDEPVEIFEVGVAEGSPLKAPLDSEKAWRVKEQAIALGGGDQSSTVSQPKDAGAVIIVSNEYRHT